MVKLIDISGQVFGRFKVLKYNPKRKRWLCRCSCGTIKHIRSGHLRSGRIVSCGCFFKERMTKHGQSKNKKVTKIYNIWRHIHLRCKNKDQVCYSDYGGRGIKVCDRWSDFTLFAKDMGPMPSPDHSIDRINNNGDYFPENCRWATNKVQARNRRDNIWLEYNGERMVKEDWGRRLNVYPSTISRRIAIGWSFNKICEYYKNKKPTEKHKIWSNRIQETGREMDGRKEYKLA